MNNKSKILVVGVMGVMSVAAFGLSTNYSNRDDIVEQYRRTTDGSYFTKHLSVNEEGSLTTKEDLDASGEGVQSGTAQVTETPGEFQGFWADASGKNYTQSEMESFCQQVYGDYWATVKATLGLQMNDSYTAPVTAQFDPHRDKFGDIGLIHYYQTRTPFGELMNNYSKGVTSVTIGGSGCGPTALSAALSTMLHRYITPGEIMAARDTHGLRIGKEKSYIWGMWSSGNAGAMKQDSDLVCEFVRNQAYNGQQLLECTREPLIQSRVDETLDKGGFIILVPHGTSTTGQYWTGGGHYIAIRAKDDQGNYYTVDGSHDSGGRPQGNTDVPHPWSDLQNCDWNTVGGNNTVHYITPGPGYAAYIASIGGGGGSSSSGGSSSGTATANQSQNTEALLAMDDLAFWKTISDNRFSSYQEASAAYAANPSAEKSFWEGMVEEIEVPCWQWADAAKTQKKESKITIKVNKNAKSLFVDFMTDLYKLPEQYVIVSVGGFEPRLKNNGSSNPGLSGHTFGTTLDINAYCVGMGSVAAPQGGNNINYPVEHASSLQEPDRSQCCTYDSSWFALAKRYQLNWGGTWSDTYKDPMHFSMVGDGSPKGQAANQKRGSKWQ